jgi:hypothetical protein
MKTYIPISILDALDARVKKSILNQTVKTDIELVWNTPFSSCKRKGEFEGRDKIVKGVDLADRYCVVNDSDIRHLYADNFECQEKYLNENKNVGAVCLFWNGSKTPNINYLRIASTMWRTEILAKMPMLDYDGGEYGCCHCMRYKSAVESFGYKIVILDNMQRIKEI